MIASSVRYAFQWLPPKLEEEKFLNDSLNILKSSNTVVPVFVSLAGSILKPCNWSDFLLSEATVLDENAIAFF